MQVLLRILRLLPVYSDGHFLTSVDKERGKKASLLQYAQRGQRRPKVCLTYVVCVVIDVCSVLYSCLITAVFFPPHTLHIGL